MMQKGPGDTPYGSLPQKLSVNYLSFNILDKVLFRG